MPLSCIVEVDGHYSPTPKLVGVTVAVPPARLRSDFDQISIRVRPNFGQSAAEIRPNYRCQWPRC